MHPTPTVYVYRHDREEDKINNNEGALRVLSARKIQRVVKNSNKMHNTTTLRNPQPPSTYQLEEEIIRFKMSPTVIVQTPSVVAEQMLV